MLECIFLKSKIMYLHHENIFHKTKNYLMQLRVCRRTVDGDQILMKYDQ